MSADRAMLGTPLLPSKFGGGGSLGGLRSPDLRAATPSSVCPPSFKAGRPRKDQVFISSARISSASRTRPPEFDPDVDPCLLNDDDQQVLAGVAAIIYGHVQDGIATVRARSAVGSAVLEDFDEARFAAKRSCDRFRRWRCCCCARRARPREVTLDVVQKLINDLTTSLFFCKQIVVLSAVYMDRLLSKSAGVEAPFVLTCENWRSVLVAALLISSKVWEDVHPWNVDFEDCLLDVAGLRCAKGALYRLEVLFLERLEWRVHVSGEEYASYFFSLLPDGRAEGGGSPRRSGSLKSRMRGPSSIQRCWTETFELSTIHEDRIMDGDEDVGSRLSENDRTTVQSVRQLRQDILDADESLDKYAMGAAWRLDPHNPLLGSLRHAPPALAPSRHIKLAPAVRWAHELARRTSNMMATVNPGSSATLSGATGASMAAELKRFLEAKARGGKEAEQQNPFGSRAASDEDGQTGLSALSFV